MSDAKRHSILIVSPWLYPIDKGGVGLSVRTLIEALQPSLNVCVLVPDWTASPAIDTVVDGLEVRRMALPLPYGGGNWFKQLVNFVLRSPSCLMSLRRYIRQRQIDLIHINYPISSFYYFKILGRLMNIPYVITVHGSDVVNQENENLADRILKRNLLRGTSRVVAVSQFLRGKVDEFVPNSSQAAVIYGAVSMERERLGATAIRLPERYFVTVGGFVPVKGQDILLRAWAQLPAEAKDVAIVLVGDGELGPRYHILVEQLGLSECVHFAGILDNREARAIIEEAIAVVIPSRSEGLSLVALEAGLAGTPVIASRVGGLPEIVTDGVSGLLVPPEDPMALADALACIALDPQFAGRLGAALKTDVRKRFRVDQLAASYTKLYADVLRDASTGRDRCRNTR